MDPRPPVSSFFLRNLPTFSSTGTRSPAYPSPESYTPDNRPSSSLWGYSYHISGPSQQASTSSTTTTSLPSTPPTGSNFTPSPPGCMHNYTIPASAMDPRRPTPAPASSSRTPNQKQKKISRPPNAFMIFRSWLIRTGKLPLEVKRHQQNISKIAGRAWNMLDESSKDEWRNRALERLEEYERNLADSEFDPSPKNSRARVKKTRKAVKDSGEDTAGRLKTLPDVDRRARRAKRPRREHAAPYKFPDAESPPQGHQTSPLIPCRQTGSPPSLVDFDFEPPAPPSAQFLSPLPLHPQLHTFAQEASQQPLPEHMFLPPELPNHFHKAYEQEDGTIVFSDNYAPINPFSPPPGYYTGMFPVTKTSQAATGPARILDLYELGPPYPHLNPSFSGGTDEFPIPQPPAGASPVLAVANPPPSSLAAYEQGVYSAILKNEHPPFVLDSLVPSSPQSCDATFVGSMASAVRSRYYPTPSPPSPYYISTLAEEVSFVTPETCRIA